MPLYFKSRWPITKDFGTFYDFRFRTGSLLIHGSLLSHYHWSGDLRWLMTQLINRQTYCKSNASSDWTRQWRPPLPTLKRIWSWQLGLIKMDSPFENVRKCFQFLVTLSIGSQRTNSQKCNARDQKQFLEPRRRNVWLSGHLSVPRGGSHIHQSIYHF